MRRRIRDGPIPGCQAITFCHLAASIWGTALFEIAHRHRAPSRSEEKSKRLATALQYRGGLKRALDLVLCLVMLPAVIPIIFVLFLLSFLCGGGFFGHVRCGKGGRRFRCWKIQTMVPNAEDQLERTLNKDPKLRREWLRSQKLKRDPRVTSLGRVLRKTGLDELPQVWNVLIGDMSIVGPRPVTEQELERYGARRVAYEGLRPGITGLWQVSGKNQLSYLRRIELDNRYSENLSWRLDIYILIKTLFVLLKGRG